MSGAAKITLLLELKNKISGAFQRAKDHVNSNVTAMKDKISSLKEHHVKAFSAMKDEIPGFSRAMELATNPYTIITAAVVGLGVAFSQASAKAHEFDTAMAKANVTAQLDKAGLRKTGNQLLDIAAGSSAKGAAQSAPSAYNILLSSGMAEKTAMASVKPTLDAAKAGFTDIETVARALANTMNSSGIKDANKVFDILFATMNAGNAEFADIANYLPKIIPAAQNVGLNLQQVAGAMAFLTAQGLKSEQAATGLENTFKVLGSPDRVASFKAIGVNIHDATGKMLPLTKIVEQLTGALDGLTDQQRSTVLSSLGLDMQASMALGIMAQNADELRKTIDFTTNSTGQLGEAITNSSQPMDAWTQIANAIDVKMIKVGQTINAVFGAFGQWLLTVMPYLEDLGVVIASVAGALLLYNIQAVATAVAMGAVGIATGIATAATWLWNAALAAIAANPIGALFAALGLVVGVLIVAYNKSEKFRAAIAGLIEVVKLFGNAFMGVGKVIVGALTLNPALFKEGLAQTATAFTEIAAGGVSKAFNKGFNESLQKSKEAAAKEQTEQTSEKTNVYKKPNDKVQAVLDGEKKKQQEKETKIGGAEQVRNVTTNIQNLIGGNFISQNQQFAQMSPTDLERWFIEMLSRFTRGMEAGMH